MWCACGGPLGSCRREALCRSFQAPVAQRIEHLTTDQKVGGSNPSGRTIFPLGALVPCGSPPAAGGDSRRLRGFLCARMLGGWHVCVPRAHARGSMGAAGDVGPTVAVALASASAQRTLRPLRPLARVARRVCRPPPFRPWCTASSPWRSRELLHSRDGPGCYLFPVAAVVSFPLVKWGFVVLLPRCVKLICVARETLQT